MVLMTVVTDAVDTCESPAVGATLCIDSEAYDRFGPVLRHLLVGLVDQAIRVRLLSSDPRIERLTLGPVQTLVHKPLGWPATGRRIGRLLDAVSSQPPTVVHALSCGSYRLTGAIAETFDADLVLQVTSLADCSAIADLGGPRVGRFLAFSKPLATVLEEQLRVPSDRVAVIRPGLRASDRIACYADARWMPTILCLSAFRRGGGVDRLIEAVRILRRRDHELMLFLLGEGRWEGTLRRMIRDRALSSYVTLAHPAGDLIEAMHTADIFVRPSVDTAFHADVLQAMGAGMAVVTFPNAVCDQLLPEETAITCEKESAEGMADAIERLLVDRPFARRLAGAAAEHVRAHHAVSAMAEHTADAYRKLALTRTTFSIKE